MDTFQIMVRPKNKRYDRTKSPVRVDQRFGKAIWHNLGREMDGRVVRLSQPRAGDPGPPLCMLSMSIENCSLLTIENCTLSGRTMGWQSC